MAQKYDPSETAKWPDGLATYDPARFASRAEWHRARAHVAKEHGFSALRELQAAVAAKREAVRHAR